MAAERDTPKIIEINISEFMNLCLSNEMNDLNKLKKTKQKLSELIIFINLLIS